MRGVVFDHPPFDGFVRGLETGLDLSADSEEEGLILIRVVDDGVLRAEVTFLRSECEIKFKKDFVHRVKCSGDGNNRKAKFVKHPLGRDVFRFALTMKKLDIHPFLLEEVTVIITTGAADRPDVIGDLKPCDLKRNKAGDAHKSVCKEPGLL